MASSVFLPDVYSETRDRMQSIKKKFEKYGTSSIPLLWSVLTLKDMGTVVLNIGGRGYVNFLYVPLKVVRSLLPNDKIGVIKWKCF